MAYIAIADVQARISAADYNRAFDRDGTNIPATITANCQQAINGAISYVNMVLGESFGPLVALDANGAVIDEFVKSNLVALAIWEGIRFSPLATGAPTSPYRQAYLDAQAFFDKLRKDDGARLQTSAGGRAKPRANLNNLQQSDGITYNDPFGRVTDGKDPVSF